MRSNMKRLIGVLAIVLIVAGIGMTQNRTVTLANFTRQPMRLTCDTTETINVNIDTVKAVKGLELGRIIQFIIRVDSVVSNSDSVGYRASDSSYFRFKVQSSFGDLPNMFWSSICSVTTGSSGADTGTWVMEKVMLLVADTAVAPASMCGENYRVIGSMVDSTSSPVAADKEKEVRLYGSVQVAIRE